VLGFYAKSKGLHLKHRRIYRFDCARASVISTPNLRIIAIKISF